MHYIPERYGFRWFVIIFNSFKINILLRILLDRAIYYLPFLTFLHISGRKCARICLMKVNTIPGASYALTCTAACTIHALLSDASSLVVLETENPGQYFFIAPTDTVEVSDEHALVTQTFKAAAPGLSARGGIRPGVNADLKNPTVEKAV